MGFLGSKRKINPEKYYSIFFKAKELYYTQFFDIVDLSKLMKEPSANLEDFALTPIDIQFLNIPFTTTPSQLVKILGKPHYFKEYENGSACEFKIYFYKKRFFRNKVVVQFYFVNEIFAYCIVTFLTLDLADEEKLLTLLNSKYLDPKGAASYITAIKDSNGYYLYYEKLFYSSLVYINNSLEVKEALSNDDRQMSYMKKVESHYNEWKDSL